ncbi:L,D-transpeptidase [Bacteroidales bacterium OttesenSCG-928-L03]|nr:L,D-transpeptidase [Bacteroidales bacterium OttesenSCG-928-L03]
MMKLVMMYLITCLLLFTSCMQVEQVDPTQGNTGQVAVADSLPEIPPMEGSPRLTVEDIVITRELLYDKYTLEDVYPYKDTTRMFQWEKVQYCLFFLDSIQEEKASWGILQNYKHRNKEAAVVKDYHRNEYKLVTDPYGVSRYQSAPVYSLLDSVTPERYGRDGSLVKIREVGTNFTRVSTISFAGDWLVPNRYIKPLPDSVAFKKVIVVDVTNQNIATLDKAEGHQWLVRSMNPSTTGLHRPPYQHETPLGLFAIQEKKPKMIYLKDGSTETGGFSPWASRFCNGGYIHGVPVNVPRTSLIEYSQTLGTTPRSHMCVRTATSHAEFIYNWQLTNETVVFVID